MKTTIHPQHGLDALKPYVPGRPIEEVQREYGIQDVIKLASNENPWGTSPKALAALQEAVTHVNLYPDGQSYALRRAIARHFDFPQEMVTVGNGADGLIMELCMAYLEESSEVIVSRSSFPIYDNYTHIMRATLIKTPLTHDYRLNLAAMADAVTERTKIIFVCNPNNPTGSIVTAAEVESFLARVPDHVIVVFDEAYYEFVTSENYPDTLNYLREGRENIIVMRTFSKVYGLAGIRLGYGFTHPQILANMHRVKEPFAVNLLAQVACEAALDDKDFESWTIQNNQQGRKFLYDAFKRLGLFYVPSHTNFILVELGPRAAELITQMQQQGVITRPCANYDLPTFARVTIGTPAQNERFIQTLEKLLSS